MLKDYLRIILEALNLNVPKRISLSIGCLLILLTKLVVDRIQNKTFFDVWTGLFFVTFVFALATSLADLYTERRNERDKEQKSREKLKTRKTFILDLEGRQLNIVKSLYFNEHHRGYLTDNDTDVLTLVAEEIIVQTSKYNYFYSRDNTGEVDNRDVKHLYILTPPALEIIKQHSQKFE